MQVRFPPRAPPAESVPASSLPSLLSSASAPSPAPFPTPTPLSSTPQFLASLPRRLVGVSTKAYFTHARTLAYVRALLHVRPPTNPAALRVFFIPSLPGVATAALVREQAALQHAASAAAAVPHAAGSARGGGAAAPPLNLLLGAQDCHFAPAGAHTGSVPASELAELGCSLVELGHAERRRAPLLEGDAMTAAKARIAVAAGLVPLVCVGEARRGPSDAALAEVAPQVNAVLRAVGPDAHVVFAYEPVWAIGQPEPAPPSHVCAVAAGIKALAAETRKEGRGEVRVIYGGSAGPGIWEALKGDLDGLFLGRFGHDVKKLAEVIDEMGRD